MNLGAARLINGQVKFFGGQGLTSILMGIIHGHYDEKIPEGMEMDEYEKINMGIAIVTPIQNAIKFIKETSAS